MRRRIGELRTSSLRARLRSQVRELDAMGVSIVSNNCVAGILYEIADVPKRSPTAGIYFSNSAYAQFLEDLAADRTERWVAIDSASLSFKTSQQCWALPVGDGELVFLHYPDRDDAIQKWHRRMERLRGRTPFVISSIQGGITLKSLQQPLREFRYSFTVDGDPAPPADEIVLLPAFLRDLCAYIDRIIGGTIAGCDDRLSLFRYS